jgi:hypothetical protein
MRQTFGVWESCQRAEHKNDLSVGKKDKPVVFSAPRIELGTFRLQSNITVERDTVQVSYLHDLKVLWRFERTTNYTKRRFECPGEGAW